MYIKIPMTQDSAGARFKSPELEALPATQASGKTRERTPDKTTEKAPAEAATGTRAPRRIQVRKSGVHGRGVFSVAPLRKNEVILEYKGEVITWKEALRRHPHDPEHPDHTFYFHLDDKHVIDGKFAGNSSRWINHACTPNCEAELSGSRIFIKALRAIKPGTELFFDYGLVTDERHTQALKERFECRCGTRGCRGTMLAPKR